MSVVRTDMWLYQCDECAATKSAFPNELPTGWVVVDSRDRCSTCKHMDWHKPKTYLINGDSL